MSMPNLFLPFRTVVSVVVPRQSRGVKKGAPPFTYLVGLGSLKSIMIYAHVRILFDNYKYYIIYVQFFFSFFFTFFFFF